MWNGLLVGKNLVAAFSLSLIATQAKITHTLLHSAPLTTAQRPPSATRLRVNPLSDERSRRAAAAAAKQSPLQYYPVCCSRYLPLVCPRPFIKRAWTTATDLKEPSTMMCYATVCLVCKRYVDVCVCACVCVVLTGCIITMTSTRIHILLHSSSNCSKQLSLGLFAINQGSCSARQQSL